ncbi:hypothetical protein SCHPADRAFT_439252 [Schizopora paradoxa]|uniref:DUF6534 domain-containing protein n=1 Tax=Schizopora paradoxa TaxID=27342 RepID=A0A0H2S562_9AGAM|nr:hypothetical protein SCHPADRAFT_439252 [Schizopora paradoxa]
MSTATVSVPDHLLDEIFGALLLGTLIACALYGLTSHQFFRYYRRFPHDPTSMKYIVAVMWILDTICVVFSMHASYYFTVTHHARSLESLDIVWSLRMSVFLTGILAFITHVFFAIRIHKLSNHNLWISGTIGSVTAIRIAFSIASLKLADTQSSFSAFLTLKFDVVVYTMIAAAASEVVLTAGLLYFLIIGEKSFTNADSIFDRVLVYLINTGLLRSMLVFACLFCAAFMKSNLVFAGIYFIFSKLYTNSFMAVLNARRSNYVPSQIGSFDLGQDFVAAPGALGVPAVVTIHITQEYHTTADRRGSFLDLESSDPSKRMSSSNGTLNGPSISDAYSKN